MKLYPYTAADKEEWDTFIRDSKNGTFLFFRDYLEYHQDRFVDSSLLVRDDEHRLVALLPASRHDSTLISHGGLTYGGFVCDRRMTIQTMLEVFETSLEFCKSCDIIKLIYKVAPHIYHRFPAEEDQYALFRLGATLYRRDVTTTVIPLAVSNLQKRRQRSVQKALKRGVQFELSERYKEFWEILEWNLKSAHGLRPVHSLEEILLLRERFPHNIKLYAASLDAELVAGTVIYETHMVAHAQYSASSSVGRAFGALDLVFYQLLSDVYRTKPYFDFGVSTEDEGRFLNQGLAEFKEGFGGRTITHDFYRIELIPDAL